MLIQSGAHHLDGASLFILLKADVRTKTLLNAAERAIA